MTGMGFRPLAQERAYESRDFLARMKANRRAKAAYAPKYAIPKPQE
jgi:hypothetical protein